MASLISLRLFCRPFRTFSSPKASWSWLSSMPCFRLSLLIDACNNDLIAASISMRCSIASAIRNLASALILRIDLVSAFWVFLFWLLWPLRFDAFRRFNVNKITSIFDERFFRTFDIFLALTRKGMMMMIALKHIVLNWSGYISRWWQRWIFLNMSFCDSCSLLLITSVSQDLYGNGCFNGY